MADFPALPIWTDALIGDTTHLTCEEFGAYMLLLIAAWRRPDCDLPDDDEMLARYARLSAHKWGRIKRVIRPFFTAAEGAVLHQKRLRKERLFLAERSEKQRQKAYAKHRKTNKTCDAVAHAADMPTHTHTQEEDTPLSTSYSPPPMGVGAWLSDPDEPAVGIGNPAEPAAPPSETAWPDDHGGPDDGDVDQHQQAAELWFGGIAEAPLGAESVPQDGLDRIPGSVMAGTGLTLISGHENGFTDEHPGSLFGDMPPDRQQSSRPTAAIRARRPSDSDIAQAVALWNDLAATCGLSFVAKVSETRRRKLSARLQDCGGLDGWRDALAKVRDSPGLLGQNRNGWKAGFDFLLQESSFIKLMEGQYSNWGPPRDTKRKSRVEEARELMASFSEQELHA